MVVIATVVTVVRPMLEKRCLLFYLKKMKVTSAYKSLLEDRLKVEAGQREQSSTKPDEKRAGLTSEVTICTLYIDTFLLVWKRVTSCCTFL